MNRGMSELERQDVVGNKKAMLAETSKASVADYGCDGLEFQGNKRFRL